VRLFASVFLALGFFLLSTFQLTADERPAIDAKKLIGKWEGDAVGVKAVDGENKTIFEFTADGVIKLKVIAGNVTISNDGKYTLEGDKLTIITQLGKDKEAKSVATITKLTDTELEWLNNGKMTEKWKRVKEEKK